VSQTTTTETFERAIDIAERLRRNVETVVLGKDDPVTLVVAALACGGHVLLEDVPGTAKTVLARATAGSIEGAAASRIQCTPDLQPTDITGLSIWNPQSRVFEFRGGPIFANVVLVDEINRALPKAQSALLEAMAERQVTVDGVTRPLPSPFLLIATENPIEQEGTFALPEAQLDRFFVRTSLGYPDADDEVQILDDQRHGHPLTRLRTVVTLEELDALAAAVEQVYVDPLLKRWIVDLVRATRGLELVEVGASVRGSLALERAARAWALLHGRTFASPDDVEALFVPVIGHRLLLAPELVVEGDLSRDEAVARVFAACLERAPRPKPDWDAEARAAGA
jgi:MoxR-like ATPase